MRQLFQHALAGQRGPAAAGAEGRGCRLIASLGSALSDGPSPAAQHVSRDHSNHPAKPINHAWGYTGYGDFRPFPHRLIRPQCAGRLHAERAARRDDAREEADSQHEGGVVIVPTAGTEQNGPHMVLGKHKFIINHASNLIARELGNALVAPVMTYVPEGNVEAPSGHLAYAGTITLPNEYFMKVLEYAARSLAVHGFTDIVFIGDSGGNQRGMDEVASLLNAAWADAPSRVHFVGEYYSANGFRDRLNDQGHDNDTIGGHAGIADTSQLLFVNPDHIRADKLAPRGGGEGSGVSGDPTLASTEYGAKGLQLKVEVTVNRVRALIAER